MKVVEPDISIDCETAEKIVTALIDSGSVDFGDWEVTSQELGELKFIKMYGNIEFVNKDKHTRSSVKVLKDSWLVESYEDLMELLL